MNDKIEKNIPKNIRPKPVISGSIIRLPQSGQIILLDKMDIDKLRKAKNNDNDK